MPPRISRRALRVAYAAAAVYYAAHYDMVGYRAHLLGLMMTTMDGTERRVSNA